MWSFFSSPWQQGFFPPSPHPTESALLMNSWGVGEKVILSVKMQVAISVTGLRGNGRSFMQESQTRTFYYWHFVERWQHAMIWTTVNYKWGHSVIVLGVCVCQHVFVRFLPVCWGACVLEMSCGWYVQLAESAITGCWWGWRKPSGSNWLVKQRYSRGDRRNTNFTQQNIHNSLNTVYDMLNLLQTTHFTPQMAYFSEKHSAMFVINNPIFSWMNTNEHKCTA